ncbi:hypothetical protein [uncultured Hyphomicrobium sp.]|uniref:hypothetical protein n=1 Tax=uncultured Hyphomicrobium sp. TaxID=194373 RepID=UPI0025F7CD69|nr:hypothetical protein [uncultured Hyphomicrobium sp.]
MASDNDEGSLAALAIRSLQEIAIIIIGILIALAVNDWWTNRVDRAEEQSILESIHDDVDATLKLIQDTRSRVETDLRKLTILSAGSAGEAGRYDAERMAEALHSLWDVPPLAMLTSTHKELQTSGRLRLIADPKVRRLLAHFQQKYEFASLTYNDAFQHQHLKLDPYVLGNIQMSQLSRYALEYDAGPSAVPLVPLAPIKDHRPLLDDATFQNHVAAKYFLLTYYLHQTHELTDVLNELNAELVKLTAKH